MVAFTASLQWRSARHSACPPPSLSVIIPIRSSTRQSVSPSHPHVWLWLNTTGAKGAAEAWGFEGASPVVLQKLGWTRTALKAGDKVTVRYSPLHDGRHGGAFATVRLPDGRELGGGSPGCTEKR